MNTETINYRVEQFEGPLELLLSLVIKNKLKIDDIPIDLLCEQYMAYISEATMLNIDVACEFLYMASELMLIKSRMLLPRAQDNSDDPRTPLVNAIIEYQRAKLASAQLSDMFAEYGSRMIKETDDISPDKTYVAPHDAELLRTALIHVLTEVKLNGNSSSLQDEFNDIVNAPRIPVQAVITGLIERLKVSESNWIFLDDYFVKSDRKPDLNAKFIGVLELLKSHIIKLEETLEIKEEGGVTDMMSHAKIILIGTDEEIKASSLEWEE